MERRQALALASTATLLVGSAIVSVASVSGASFLGFGGRGSHSTVAGAAGTGAAPTVLHATRNIYDRYVVETGGASTTRPAPGRAHATSAAARIPSFAGGEASGSGDPVASTPTTGPGADRLPDPSISGGSHAPGPHETPTTEPDDVTPITTPPTTAPPTSIPTTTTTWPRGVPRDWPKNQPIPPMPPNCREPQLEDNGVWNCDH